MLRLAAAIVLLAIGAFAVGNCDGSGNCYVSILATGTGSGADWANACIDFNGACDVTNVAIRGTTIWVGGSPGNYLGPAYKAQTFSAPDSGTTPITIIAASAANHGTDTGWRRQSATAIVPFTGPISINTDYWTFNGQFRGVNQNQTQSQGGGTYHDVNYGYHMQVVNTTGTANGAIQVYGNNVTIEYMYVQGSPGVQGTTSGAYGGSATDNGIVFATGTKNEYVGYSWIGYTGADSIDVYSGSNYTFEYNLFSKNHMGSPGLSSQAINVGDVTNLIIRYNHFQDITGSAILTDGLVDANAFTPNWYFYGNDIFWDNVVHTGTLYGLSAGIINLTGETFNGGVIHVFNNTIAGINVAACTSTQPCNTTALNLNGSSPGGCSNHTQNCYSGTQPVGQVYNNLWWNPYNAVNTSSNTNAAPQWTPTADYGEGICATTGCTNGGSFTVVGANDISVTTGNPFKSFNAVMGNPNWYNFNLLLAADTAAGLSITGWSSTPPGCTALNCESADGNMVTRGQNGTIDRGAFQINSRTLLSVGVVNSAIGLHIGSTFTEVPVCTWSSAPTSDACPDGSAPFIKQWVSLDNTKATISSTGVVTGVANGNALINLQYGGISSDNSGVVIVTDGLGTKPIATLPTGIVRTGSPMAFASYDTTQFDANFPTTYSLPTGGKTWSPINTVADFTNALAQSNPGDVIVLTAGTTYSTNGQFLMPAKSNPNNKWIYIISSAAASLPPQGTRIRPSDAVNMPKLVQTGGSSTLVADAGANHWWISGIEFISQATGNADPTKNPPALAGHYAAVNTNAPDTPPNLMPDSITIDRCYMHGDATHDVFHIITGNASHFAVLDSYVATARSYQAQAQGLTSYFTPGPYKIINNLFSANGEDSLMGGSGGFSNMWVLRDAYFSHNTFWNDPSLRTVDSAGGILGTIPPLAPYNYNNNFEYKICQRCLADGNLMINSWVASQGGGSILANTGTGVNGPDAVLSDLTYSNNIIIGAIVGFVGTEFALTNNGCGQFNSPCQYPGEARRLNYFNNLFVQGPQGTPGGRALSGGISNVVALTRVLTDYLSQHNTFVGPYVTDHTYCDASFYFQPNVAPNGSPSDLPPTQNMWLLDNVLCRQITGAGGGGTQGTPQLNIWMSDPTTVPFATTRFQGNVMQLFSSLGDNLNVSYPTNNTVTPNNFTYNSPTTGDYTLVSPVQPASDGAPQSGINYTILMQHQAPALGTCSISGTAVVSGSNATGISLGTAVTLTGGSTTTTYTNADGTYSFPGLAADSYVVTPYSPAYSFSPASITVNTATTCASTAVNFTSTPLPTYTLSGTATLNGAALSGVTMRLSGEAITTTNTDANGNYSFTLLQNSGSYNLNPSLTGYSFSPNGISKVVSNANIPGQNFTATQTAATYSISGTVLGAGGTAIAGVNMGLSGGNTSITIASASDGTYTFSNIANGSYTITPSRTGYTFTPTSLPVNVSGANITGQNFTGNQVISTFSISGTVSGVISSGLTLNLSGGTSASVITSSTGTYTFQSLSNGTYTVTPAPVTGYSFSPSAITVTINNANASGQNFVSSVSVAKTGLVTGHIGPTHPLAAKKSKKSLTKPQ